MQSANEPCRRLIRAGMVPARAGQPTQVLVHMSLAELRGLPGGSPAEAAWAAARASQPGWLTGPDADAALCDATVVPVVTGHVDGSALDHLTDAFLLAHAPGHTAGPGQEPGPGQPGPCQRTEPGHRRDSRARPGRPADPEVPTGSGICERNGGGCNGGGCNGAGCDSGGCNGGCRGGEGVRAGRAAEGGTGPVPVPIPPSPATRDRLQRALLGLAADALSGPGGLAARLRAIREGSPLSSVSLPLDIGAATETIPAHLRRAATTRHPHCAFPGCDQPASVCDIHHLIPRARGGPTSLANLVPLCGFHHQIAVHRWGWTLTLHSDGTTTATSPDHTRTLHSHGPPGHDPPSHGPPSHRPPSQPLSHRPPIRVA